MGKIEIQLSKRKVMLTLLGALVLTLLGIFGAVLPENFISPFFRNPEVIRLSGIAGACFFGFCLSFIVRKLFDGKPGLIINEFGIINNTDVTDIGLVEWNDIIEIEKKSVMSTNFLLIHVHCPEKYVLKAKNNVSKRAMIMNLKTYGTPISIISNSLKINFEELETLITLEFKRTRSSKLV